MSTTRRESLSTTSDNNEAAAASTSSSSQVSYAAERVIDNGSFGVVFQAVVVETGEVVAIKKVLLDRRFRNRELKIMKMLKHPFICGMKHCFYSNGDKGTQELYLNLVLEYMPTTVYKYTRNHLRMKKKIPIICVQLLIYQLCRALAYLHAKGICHRDIKPQNLLMDTDTMVLKLCDFGSAKQLKKGEPNVAYICSRYYRAPELIFGCVNYTTRIDIWSTGCVCAGLLLGQPLFPGVSGVDQLVEIIKVLGTPTKTQIFAMNRNYTELKFPDVKAREWSTVLTGSHIPPAAIEFVSKVLRYEPKSRLTPLQACQHPFFDHLRQDPSRTAVLLPNRKPLPDHLFTFTKEEIEVNPSVVCQLIPKHARTAETWTAPLENAWKLLTKPPSDSGSAPASPSPTSPSTSTTTAAASAAADSAVSDFPNISDSEDNADKGKDS